MAEITPVYPNRIYWILSPTRLYYVAETAKSVYIIDFIDLFSIYKFWHLLEF